MTGAQESESVSTKTQPIAESARIHPFSTDGYATTRSGSETSRTRSRVRENRPSGMRGIGTSPSVTTDRSSSTWILIMAGLEFTRDWRRGTTDRPEPAASAHTPARPSALPPSHGLDPRRRVAPFAVALEAAGYSLRRRADAERVLRCHAKHSAVTRHGGSWCFRCAVGFQDGLSGRAGHFLFVQEQRVSLKN